ncbi:hypothetical protein PGB34_03105 [Xenophilus arseniciresistens]|uniref:DUF6896 domain-containing protein n=1 Tax=Xenophilus arseniciresistens TaxID=1283306 RepID=A0AAE3SZL0_9BURK|nr:hypothetical protein [Xenophilus arseniciresistens]MDA7415342.1 hypothetical protein [Xenophilus arseniciresistens]
MSSDLLDELKMHQRRLSCALLERHPEVRGNERLVGIRVFGELVVDDERWVVSQHGTGAMFTRQNPTPQLVVDMHTDLSNPDLIDPWRVQQFAESMALVLSYAEAEKLLDQRSKA